MARRRRTPAVVAADPSSPADAGPTAPRPLADRWWGKVVLLLVGVLLLSLAIAPFKQFYAAWVGLVPWLVVVRHCRGPVRAALWSWLAGILYFSANMWWLAFVTGPGLVALMALLGGYWAGAGAVLWPTLRGEGGRVSGVGGRRLAVAGSTADGSPGDARPPTPDLLPPSPAWRLLVLLPVVWVGLEWLRGTWPFNGLPWLYLCHSQTPALYLCQIADTTGELGVSAWVALVNVLVALYVFDGWRARRLLRPAAAVGGVLAAVLAYGVFRFAQTPGHLSPGPRVLVVQPNYPQDNTGNKSAAPRDIIDFHDQRTNKALTLDPAVDLVVWSETMMPELEAETRADRRRMDAELAHRGFELGDDLMDFAHRRVAGLARRYKCGLLVGSSYARGMRFAYGPGGDVKSGHVAFDARRNSVYLYQRDTGEQAGRYDKIHTVPFGEYIPFKEGWPWLYRQMISLGPPNMENYQLESGDRAVVFSLAKDRIAPTSSAARPADAWRFVTPICFEDIDGDGVAKLFRDGAARGSLPPAAADRPAGTKAADLIVNVTNDGWFGVDLFGPGDRWYRGGQMAQHLQVATFRSIENRAPTARAVNTGISGFIDSLGRTDPATLIPTGTEGTLAAQVLLDDRTTFYTRWGNLIGPACGIATAGVVLARAGGWLRRRRRQRLRG